MSFVNDQYILGLNPSNTSLTTNEEKWGVNAGFVSIYSRTANVGNTSLDSLKYMDDITFDANGLGLSSGRTGGIDYDLNINDGQEVHFFVFNQTLEIDIKINGLNDNDEGTEVELAQIQFLDVGGNVISTQVINGTSNGEYINQFILPTPSYQVILKALPYTNDNSNNGITTNSSDFYIEYIIFKQGEQSWLNFDCKSICSYRDLYAGYSANNPYSLNNFDFLDRWYINPNKTNLITIEGLDVVNGVEGNYDINNLTDSSLSGLGVNSNNNNEPFNLVQYNHFYQLGEKIKLKLTNSLDNIKNLSIGLSEFGTIVGNNKKAKITFYDIGDRFMESHELEGNSLNTINYFNFNFTTPVFSFIIEPINARGQSHTPVDENDDNSSFGIYNIDLKIKQTGVKTICNELYKKICITMQSTSPDRAITLEELQNYLFSFKYLYGIQFLLTDSNVPIDCATDVSISNSIITLDTSGEDTITFSNGPISIDGIVLQENMYVMIKDQTNKRQNGIYIVELANGSNVELKRFYYSLPNVYLKKNFSFLIKCGNVNGGKMFMLKSENVDTFSSQTVIEFEQIDLSEKRQIINSNTTKILNGISLYEYNESTNKIVTLDDSFTLNANFYFQILNKGTGQLEIDFTNTHFKICLNYTTYTKITIPSLNNVMIQRYGDSLLLNIVGNSTGVQFSN